MATQEETSSDAVRPEQRELRASSPIAEIDRNTVLGGGNFATVWEGTFPLKVAVKRIDLYHIQNGDKEEKALKKLSHPNVVKLYHDYSDTKFKYYVLELCQLSMDQLFKGNEEQQKYREKMPREEQVCLQLANGLAHIHEMRLIHQDLKPDNVLIQVDSTGRVWMKWTDFDQCVPVDENGCYTIIDVSGVGADTWRAPEILKIRIEGRETAQGSIKSDVFSQGLVFGYYTLGGHHPYDLGDNNKDKHILASNPKNLKDNKKNHCMYEIIMEMLEGKPEKRISSADVVTKITNPTSADVVTKITNPTSADYSLFAWVLVGAALVVGCITLFRRTM